MEWSIKPDFAPTNVSSVVRDGEKRDMKQGVVPVLSGIFAVNGKPSDVKRSMGKEKELTEDINKPATSDSSGKVNLALKVPKIQLPKPRNSFNVGRKVVISSSKSNFHQKDTGCAVENDLTIKMKRGEAKASKMVSLRLPSSSQRHYSSQTTVNGGEARRIRVNNLHSQIPSSALVKLMNNSRFMINGSNGLQPTKTHRTVVRSQLVAVPIGDSITGDSTRKSPMVIVMRKKAESLALQENLKSATEVSMDVKAAQCEKTGANHYPRKQSLKPVAKEWFLCTECPARFRFGPSLAEHAVKHHRTFLCTECDINFELQCDLQIHLKTHSSRKLNACLSCDFISKTESGLRAHAKIHITGKPFSCGRCFAEFNKSLNFHRHILGHKTEKLYKCDNCTANFTSKNGIQAHMVVHSDENPFCCTVCPAKFKKAGTLKKHLMRSHVCSYCPAKFKRKVKLKAHLRTHQ